MSRDAALDDRRHAQAGIDRSNNRKLIGKQAQQDKGDDGFGPLGKSGVVEKALPSVRAGFQPALARDGTVRAK
ncbi:MAG: hypothetical protein U0987_04850 [Afipia sp.]|nr:hypothetical protein [Afipia sp.]